MRPRERHEQDDDSEAAPPSEPSPAPKPSARGGGGLSSMVVRPSPPESEEGGEGSEPDNDGGRSNRRGDSPDLPHYRRWDRPQSLRRRGDSADELPGDRGDSSPDYRRRRHNTHAPLRHGGSSPDERRRVCSPGFQHRYPRFHEDSGNSLHAGSASPLRHRPDALRHEPDFDNIVGPRGSHGFRGGRGGRFRDASPNHRRGRGGRLAGRGFAASGWGRQPPHGEYIHRNDPNLSPREGDWICQNPSCGNLNFARRTHCNNCNEYRYGADLDGPAWSPRRGYFDSSPTRGSAARIFGPPIDRSPRKNVDRYRSPRGWEFDDPRDFRPRPPSQGHARRFTDQMLRNFPKESEYRVQDKSGWSESQWNGRDIIPHRFISERRGYDRRTPSPGAQWIPRQRSRSPLAERALKASYLGRARGDRPFDSYADHGPGDDSDAGRGRGYHHRDSFTGRGRSVRRGRGHW